MPLQPYLGCCVNCAWSEMAHLHCSAQNSSAGYRNEKLLSSLLSWSCSSCNSRLSIFCLRKLHCPRYFYWLHCFLQFALVLGLLANLFLFEFLHIHLLLINLLGFNNYHEHLLCSLCKVCKHGYQLLAYAHHLLLYESLIFMIIFQVHLLDNYLLNCLVNLVVSLQRKTTFSDDKAYFLDQLKESTLSDWIKFLKFNLKHYDTNQYFLLIE